MAKIATVKLTWLRSPSSDAASVEIRTTVNGNTTTIEGPITQESFTLECEPNSSVTFSVITFDSEGLATESESHSFVLGDLDAPLPATALNHEIVSIHEA